MSISKKLVFNTKVSDIIQRKLSQIDFFNFEWGLKSNESISIWLNELKHTATIQSIGSSTRIEGSALSNEEVEELLTSITIQKFQSRDEQEVLGYYDAIKVIYENYKEIKLTESFVKQLHGTLLKYSTKDTRHKGKYKALSNKVIAKLPNGQSKIVFNTTEPYLVDKEMSELIAWSNDHFKKEDIHHLLIIGLFVYEFLSIHPFQDGNGRLSRLLTNLLMMREGYTFIQYLSLEHIIENQKQMYYRALMDGQRNRYSSKEDISMWIIFFLDCIESAIDRLQAKLEPIRNLSRKAIKTDVYLNDRQRQILAFMKRKQSLKLSDIVDELTNISRITLIRDLKYLVENKLIKKSGKGRGTFYKSFDTN